MKKMKKIKKMKKMKKMKKTPDYCYLSKEKKEK